MHIYLFSDLVGKNTFVPRVALLVDIGSGPDLPMEPWPARWLVERKSRAHPPFLNFTRPRDART